MELIDALEPGMRGNHAGNVGYPAFSGGVGLGLLVAGSQAAHYRQKNMFSGQG